jgi:uncharacterized membrane protein YjjP (DUF1212 family)
MKKYILIFVLVIFSTGIIFSQSNQGNLVKLEQVKKDSTLYKKYKMSFDNISRSATDLKNNIDNANKQLDEMIGQLKLLDALVREQESLLVAPVKKDETLKDKK